MCSQEAGRDAGGRLRVGVGHVLELFGRLDAGVRSRGRWSGTRRASADRGSRARCCKARVSSRTKSRIDRCCSRRSLRFLPRSAGEPAPKSRSKTKRGIGLGSHRQRWGCPRQVELVGARIAGIAVARTSARRRRSVPARETGSGGRSALAATWSTETPAWMSAPAVFLTRTPVRNVPLARAWSPGPSMPPVALSWSRPPRDLDLALEPLQRLQGPESARSLSLPSWATSDFWLTPLGT